MFRVVPEIQVSEIPFFNTEVRNTRRRVNAKAAWIGRPAVLAPEKLITQ